MTTTDERMVGYLRTQSGGAAPIAMMRDLGISKKTLYNNLHKLMDEGKVVKVGSGMEVVYRATGVELGIRNQELGNRNEESTNLRVYETRRDKDRKEEPPLVSLKITNPVTYLRIWWKKVMGNEGVDVRFRIKPLTAFGLAAISLGAGVGLGRISLPEPVVKYLPALAPTPSPDPWKETAYRGILRYTPLTKKYRLEIGDGEAVTLEVPRNVKLDMLVGKKIFAAGKFNIQTEVLVVAEAEDLEVLVKVAPVPTVATGSGEMR